MIKVAILGATGIVGQQFVAALEEHPWFKLEKLLTSPRSAGKTYEESLRNSHTGALEWFCDSPVPSSIREMVTEDSSQFDPSSVDLIFSALESEQARTLEPSYAKTTPIVSTASAFRYEHDVPILIPGINDQHVDALNTQREGRGWSGFIVPIPNCTTTGLAISLKPLHADFVVEAVVMTSMQAVSGAGRSSGVLALDITDNIVPFIPGEEEKVEKETCKILGGFQRMFTPAEIKISCTCTRVNVREGHTEAVFVKTREKCNVDDAKKSMLKFSKTVAASGLPTAPPELLLLHEDPSRPQPRLDRDTNGGMTTVIGRLREDKVLGGVKYVLVSHNTKMGAAKGAVLVAELLRREGYVGR
ncbi:MAG: aspartate-semialdehyde dehydrogenase [archaeon]